MGESLKDKLSSVFARKTEETPKPATTVAKTVEPAKTDAEKAAEAAAKVQAAKEAALKAAQEKVVAAAKVEEIAKEVIQGKWGNGEERKAALEKAGYVYSEVQAKVNALLK